MGNKNLGTLTLDLIAKVGGFVEGMDKAERRTKKTAASIKTALGDVAKIGATFGVSVVAGMAAMTTSMAASAKEIKNLSTLANSSTDEFQKLAYGANRYGIEQDKVADILKDTNDKVGDFLQTGGGPLADFFENIAPQVGVTADQFARLSGKEALQLYVSSLEKANLSQAEMTFYMEAIASDSTLLLPLLKDNGKQLRALGDEAERTGNVLSDVDFDNLEDITKSTNLLKAEFSGLQKEVTLAALPAVNDLIDVLSDEQTIESAKALGGAIVESVTWAVEAIDDAVRGVRYLAQELAVFQEGISSTDVERLEKERDKIVALLNEDPGTVNIWNRVRFFGKDGLVEFYDRGELAAELTRINAAIFEYYQNPENRPAVEVEVSPTAPAPDAPSGDSGDSGARIDYKAKAAIDEQIRALQEQAATLGKTEKEVMLYKLGLEGATPEQLKLAESVLTTIEAFEAQADAEEEAADRREKALGLITGAMSSYDQQLAKIDEQQRFLTESIQEFPEIAEQAAAAIEDLEQRREGLTAAFNESLLGEFGAPDTADEEIARLNALYDQKLELIRDRYGEMSELEVQLTRQKNERIAQIEFAQQQLRLSYAADFFGNLATLAETAGGEQSKVAKAAAIVQATIKTYESANSAYAAMAGIPVVGPALGVAAAAAAIASGIANVNAIRSQSYAGAFDGGGNIPAGSWGIAGEVGPEIVEGPARVTSRRDTAETLKRVAESADQGANVTVNVANYAGDVAEASARETDEGVIEVIVQKAQQAVANDLASGGGVVSRAAESSYGLRRGVT